jgi:hypothetical protein
MKFYKSIFAVTSLILILSQNALFAQPAEKKGDRDKSQEMMAILNSLRFVQQELENKVTICNGGKILTRACPAPAESTGAGSLVKALRQTKQTIATLKLYLDKTDLK